MKKVFVFCLVLCLSVVTLGLYGCGDNSDLQSQLDETQSQLDELEDRFDNSTNAELKNQLDEANRNISALTERIQSLESTLSQSQDEIRKLTELSSTLSRTITELTDIVEDEASGNEALKAKLDTLQTQYEQTKAAVDSLSAKVSSLESDIGNLQSELNEATLRIDAIEGAVAADKTYTYNMGEECVVKAASGLELFRVKLIEYDNEINMTLRFKLQRLNLPINVEMERYFNVIAYDETNDIFCSRQSLYKGSDFTDYETIYTIGFNSLPTQVAYFIVGLTSAVEYESSTFETRNYIIPYAIYNNTSASI